MSLKKESASARLGEGVDAKGCCKGAFHLEDFQYMAEPLENPKPEYGELFKEMKVSFYFIWSTVL